MWEVPGSNPGLGLFFFEPFFFPLASKKRLHGNKQRPNKKLHSRHVKHAVFTDRSGKIPKEVVEERTGTLAWGFSIELGCARRMLPEATFSQAPTDP
jgi:hypothetical protein